MRLIIQKDYNSLSSWAAACIVRRIRQFKPGPDTPFILGLPTGSSPIGTYRELIRMHNEGLVSFKHVVTFNMDEYIGLEKQHPQSYHRFMNEQLFSHIDIPEANINIPNGTADDLEAECRRYEERISSYGGIRLFLAGVGSDGHIAFNEPCSSLTSKTRVKTLTHDTRLANSRFFNNDVSAVPESAITVGVGTIMGAKEILLIVSGQSKARALEKAVQQGVNHMWTVSCLQLHPRVIAVCDDDATVELKVGTFNYFMDIESGNLDYRKLLDSLPE